MADAPDPVQRTRLLEVRRNGTLIFAGPAERTLMPATIGPKDAVAPLPVIERGAERARYVLLGRLGAGAMGEVHVARDVDLLRKVAFKRMLPEAAGSPQITARFFSEVQVTSQLDHPNVVPIYGLEVSQEGALGYSMKLVQGTTLSALLAEAKRAAVQAPAREPQRLAERLEIFLKVCDAIAYAHSKRVLHRDLKPDNIMVGRYHDVYVMDWGICRVIGEPEESDPHAVVVTAASEQATSHGALIGTPAYMSPEQAAGKNAELDGRSDLYALGLMLHELVSLRLAVPAPSLEATIVRAQAGERDPLHHLIGRIKIAGELGAIVAKATAPRIADRYASVDELADDVRRFLRGESVAARPDGALAAMARWAGRHKLAMLALVGLALVAGAAATGAEFVLAQRREARAAQQAAGLQSLLLAVSRRANAIDNFFDQYELALAAMAAHAVAALDRPAPSAHARVYLAGDFDTPGAGPPDLEPSPFYGRPTSVDWPMLALAPGVDAAAVRGDLDRLAALRPALLDALLTTQGLAADKLSAAAARKLILVDETSALRVFVALDNGVYASYPGMGGLWPGYEPRRRPKYRLAVGTHGIRWGNPFADPYGHGLVLPCSMALYDAAGRFRGVAGIEMTFDALVAQKLPLVEARAHDAAYLVDGEGRVVVHTGAQQYADARMARARDDEPIALSPLPWPDVRRALAGATPGGSLRVDGKVVAWAPLPQLGWSYVVVINEHDL
jgi:serine/threonine-protein kinase